jgi:hypothetical protein
MTYGSRGRAVKASDSKSDSLWERRFESCRLRETFLQIKNCHCQVNLSLYSQQIIFLRNLQMVPIVLSLYLHKAFTFNWQTHQLIES